MTRHLLPRFQWGRWGGGALTDDFTPQGDQADGFHVTFQWLGLLIEIGIGTVRGGR